MCVIYAEPATQERPVSHCYQSAGPGAWIRSITYAMYIYCIYNYSFSPTPRTLIIHYIIHTIILCIATVYTV